MATTQNLGKRVEVPNELVIQENISLVKFSYTWNIDKVSMQTKKTGEKLCSPNFCVNVFNDNLTMCLEVYPKGSSVTYKDNISLFLKLVSCNKKNVTGMVKFSLLNVKNKKLHKRQSSFTFTNTVPDWGYAAFMKINQLTENSLLFPNNKYKIYCKVGITDYTKTPDQSYKVQLSNELGVLFENQRFSDVSVSVDGTEFPAHKAILAARSPVFAAMFEHEMKEINHNRVIITDLDQEVVRAMLIFMYTGEVENLENIADNLLPAADKYGLESLQLMCEKELYKSLSISNAVERLISADLHNSERLKLRATDYIITNATDVMDTPGWKYLIQQTHLFEEVFRALVRKHDSRDTDEGSESE